MPELPEVATVVHGLKIRIIGKRLTEIREFRKNTVNYHQIEPECDFGNIAEVERRGKFIIWKTSAGQLIVIHLRMTGKLVYSEKLPESLAHVRAWFRFSDGSGVYFHDVRTFGTIDLYPLGHSVKALEKLGPEPMGDDFNLEYLKNITRNRKAPIKNLLLNQNIIAGLGNIYAAEILFRAQVRPDRKAADLTISQLRRIVEQTKQVLAEAINCNGTTISDFRDSDDARGSFQRFLRVYQKDRCSCGEEIIKIKLANRSSFYCPKCQK
ncbi:MAG: bifunctional DNA-formamidopyrimidine glycosylase/DNA-(apurinic or apyrimidinic site) lyase [Candidatus Cloacimonetes bacterium]|nr:bifunctional DNA-formamidopyrimidine glycosylase/DNA-(apurinic or apyrimidinic site) lyase [Candidatus Cloacimonadota bacterium]